MAWKVRFDSWRSPPPTPTPPMTAASVGSAPERRTKELKLTADVPVPRTPPPSPSARLTTLAEELDQPLKRRSSDATTKAAKRLRDLAERSVDEPSLLVMPRMEERLSRPPGDSPKRRSYRRSLKPIMEVPTGYEAEFADSKGRRSSVTSANALETSNLQMDFKTPQVSGKPKTEAVLESFAPKLLEPNESFRLMMDYQAQVSTVPPRVRLLSDEMDELDASMMRSVVGGRRRSSADSGSKQEGSVIPPATKADARAPQPRVIPDTPAATGAAASAGTDRRASAGTERRGSIGSERRASADADKRAGDEDERRKSGDESAPLLWKTSRGPMAREPPPRRRSSLPGAMPEPLPGMLPPRTLPAKDGDRPTPTPVARVAPAKVLYAAPLERTSQRGRRESRDAESDAETQPPPPSPEPRPLPRVPSYIDVRWIKETPAASAYRPEPFIRRKDRRRSGDSRASDASAKDTEAMEERELQLLELSPEQDKEVERLQEKHLIKRGRRAYRRLMAGETKSMQDVYKMMLDLAWRHRDDPIPPPLPPPPPPESSRPPPRVQLIRPKMRKLPTRPGKPIEALPSDETFYAAAAERAMNNSRRASADRGTSIWGHSAEVRRGTFPRASVDLRPSVLLDPASWAPPDAGRRLSDPRAPPPPGRVPRGWINIMEIGAPT